MRILQLAHKTYPYSQGGVEIYTYALSRELIRRGHQVAIAASIKQTGISTDVPLYPLATRAKGYLRSPSRADQKKNWQSFKKIIDEFTPDIIHVQHLLEMGWETLERLQDLNIPFVLSLHDFFYLCPGINWMCRGNVFECAKNCLKPYRGKGYFLRLCRACWETLCYRSRYINLFNKMKAPILANSKTTASIYEQNGLMKGKVTVHALGIDISGITSEASNSDGHTFPRFGFIGGTREEKGLTYLMEAFQNLNIAHELHVWGVDSPQSSIEKKITATVKKSIFYHEEFNHAVLNQVLRTFDILVVPSVCEETYNLAIQEGLAAKKVVIASAVGGIKERIISGVNGFLIPPRDPQALAVCMQYVAENLISLKQKLDFSSAVQDIRIDGEWLENFYNQTIIFF